MSASTAPAAALPRTVLIAGSGGAEWHALARHTAVRLLAAPAGEVDAGVAVEGAGTIVALTRRECRPRAPFQGPLFEVLAAAHSVHGRSAPVGLVVPLVWVSALHDPGFPPARPQPRGGARPAGRQSGEAAGRMGEVGGPPRGRVERTDKGAPCTLPLVAAIEDHVDLAVSSPLCGPWPPGKERTFPGMSGVYAVALAERLLASADGRTAWEEASAVGRRLQRGRPTHVPSSTVCGRERPPASGPATVVPEVYSRLTVAGVRDTRRLSVWEQQQARVAGLTVAADSLVAPVVIAAFYGLAVVAVGVIATAR